MRAVRAGSPAWLTATVLAFALAGCGGSSNHSTTPASGAPSASGGSTTTPTTPTGVTPGTSAAGQAAIAACKQAIQAQTSLPSSSRSKLEAVCGKAASGDRAAVRKAAQEVCEEVIDKSAVPAGPTKEQALQTCRK